MGMDLYYSSPAGREVWYSVDAHLISAYGFSIVETVRENPKKKTIHFGGIKGQALPIRERYMLYSLVERCLLASIFRVQDLISPRHGLGPQRADAMPPIATTVGPANLKEPWF